MKITRKMMRVFITPMLLLLLGVLLSATAFFIGQHEIKNHLAKYTYKQSKISDIHELLGYGAGIHAFKNYVLRHKDNYRRVAKESMKKSLKIIDQFLEIKKLTPLEKEAALNIKITIKEYLTKLQVAQVMIDSNKSVEEIDNQVRVDDTIAIRSINILQKFFREKNDSLLAELDRLSKIVLLAICLVILITFLMAYLITKKLSGHIIYSIENLVAISDQISKETLKIDLSTPYNQGHNKDIGDDELGDLTRTIINMRENLKSTISKLESSNKELTNFAFVASHDLQEPIKKISLYTELLEIELEEPNVEAQNYMREIKNCSQRMISLIKALLNYALLDQKDLVIQKVSLDKIVSSALKNLEVSLSSSDVELQIQKLPEVCANSELLERVFQNLISNAIKFKKKNEKLQLRVSATNLNSEEVEISVSDNGIGIKEEELATILRPFGRVHSNLKYPGLGIGVPLCNKILAIHSSKLKIKSDFGSGSTFSFCLKRSNNKREIL